MVKQFTCPVNRSIILRWGLPLIPHGFYFSGTFLSFFFPKNLLFFQFNSFFSTEITYPKLIVSSYQDFFDISTEETLKQSTDMGLARLTNPCFLQFSSTSYRQQVSALRGSLSLDQPSSLHSYTHCRGCLLTLYSCISGFSSYPSHMSFQGLCSSFPCS